MRILSFVLASVAAYAACATVVRAEEQKIATKTSKYAGEVIQQAGIEPQFGETVPMDAKFVDADGEIVRLGDCFDGRPVILHLVYYECPMLCKLGSDGLLSSLAELSLKPGKDFTVITLSFDPREGPELSKGARDIAAARVGKDAVEYGWHFLTGDAASIEAVTEAVGFRYVYDESTKQYAHASGIFILTPNGTISRYLGGVNFAARDVRLVVVEASDGKVGTMADQVLMLCYMYDPMVGRYGFAIMTVVRSAGVLTVITMVIALLLMLRRERQRNRQTELFQPQTTMLESGWKA